MSKRCEHGNKHKCFCVLRQQLGRTSSQPVPDLSVSAPVFHVGVPTMRLSYLANSAEIDPETLSISMGSDAASPNSSEIAYAASSVEPVLVPKKIPIDANSEDDDVWVWVAYASGRGAKTNALPPSAMARAARIVADAFKRDMDMACICICMFFL